MVLEKNQAHRPGAFKQTNKEHKHGRHRSKGSISLATKGKVSLKTISKKTRRELNREQRRHQSTQIRQKKRYEVLSKKRSLGCLDFAPFFVTVMPLHQEFDPNTALCILSQCDEDAIVRKTSTGVTHIFLPRFKKRFSLVTPKKDNEFEILDTLKVADTVLFLLSAINGAEDLKEILDKWGHKVLISSLAQGLPTTVVALTDLESISPKKRNEFKQDVQKMVNQWLPDEKLMVLDKNIDGINILRRIGEQKRKSVFYRDRRPYLYGEEIEYIPDNEGAMGSLKVTGYLKGATLSVNQLVHIPGLGDFQMSQIDAPFDPNKVDKNRNKDGNSMSDETNTIRVLDRCDPTKQEALDSENIPDPMDAEQTWPTNEDYEMAEKEKKLKKVKKIPKGWSDYQAAWIPDDDAEFQEDDYSDSEYESADELMDAKSEEISYYSDSEDREKDFDTVTESGNFFLVTNISENYPSPAARDSFQNICNLEKISGKNLSTSDIIKVAANDDKYDLEMDLNVEKEDLMKMKAAKSDLIFPDEVDTPVETPARVRFQKYRGLESFRTSPWDPKENLPSDYARIFQFENFDRTRKRVLKEEENKDGALTTGFVTFTSHHQVRKTKKALLYVKKL